MCVFLCSPLAIRWKYYVLLSAYNRCLVFFNTETKLPLLLSTNERIKLKQRDPKVHQKSSRSEERNEKGYTKLHKVL
jgi:hypothetical protein